MDSQVFVLFEDDICHFGVHLRVNQNKYLFIHDVWYENCAYYQINKSVVFLCFHEKKLLFSLCHASRKNWHEKYENRWKIAFVWNKEMRIESEWNIKFKLFSVFVSFYFPFKFKFEFKFIFPSECTMLLSVLS